MAPLLFIDTNIILSFLHFSNDDLEELDKLALVARRGEVRWLVPQQVVDEFNRNRAGKIADALKQLRATGLPEKYPRFCQDFEEYNKLRKLKSEHDRIRGTLIDKVVSAAKDRRFRADDTINRLFAASKIIDVPSAVLEAARVRSAIGNPPGKKGSLGDAIIWESLLVTATRGDDLYFVAGDTDWSSPLDSGAPDPFLADEWSRCVGGKLLFYDRLSLFFADRYPDIKVSTELEKEILIRQLAESQTFDKTHRLLRMLSRHDDFTAEQLNDIVDAYLSNDQINGIIRDRDVRTFIGRVIRGRDADIEPLNFVGITELLGESATA